VDLSLTDDQRTLRELARQIMGDLVTTDRLKQVEAGAEQYDRDLWMELAAAGLLSVVNPPELEGLGGGMVEACLLLEEQGRTVAPVPLFPTLVLGAMPRARFGTDAQRDVLSLLASGKAVATAALPPDGGEPAVRFEDGSLRGAVDAVRAAEASSEMLVPARDGEMVRTFVTRHDQLRFEPQVMTNHEARARVIVDGVQPEPLGAEGSPDAYRWLMPRAIVGLCALQVGVCERALRLTAEYVTERHQFDRPLGSFQAVQQRLADAYIDVEAMRWTMWQAAWRLDEGLPAEQEVAIAKAWAAEAGQRVVAAAQHLHGGIGVDVEYPLHRYTLWAKDLELSLGGAGRHLSRLGDLVVEPA
jgi:alkylation response protein AidB-like acyl-CoA dehydrogenase